MPREPSAIKYHGVINNPEKKGITSESLLTLLRNIATIIYFAFGFHTAPTTGTTHIHLFIWFKNSTTFSRVKKLLPEGTHIEACKGNAEQNIDYITNSGPHKDKDTYLSPVPPDDKVENPTTTNKITATTNSMILDRPKGCLAPMADKMMPIATPATRIAGLMGRCKNSSSNAPHIRTRPMIATLRRPLALGVRLVFSAIGGTSASACCGSTMGVAVFMGC